MNFLGRLVSSLTGSSLGPIPDFEYEFKLDDPEAVSVTTPSGITWTICNGTSTSPTASTPNSSSASSSGSVAGAGGVSNDRNVSIFSCSLPSSSSPSTDLIRNVLKRARGLVLPGVLRTFGSIEYENKVYLATERCTPLRTVARSPDAFYRINQQQDDNDDNNNNENNNDENDDNNDDCSISKYEVAVCIGMNTIAGALSAMHRNQLFHGQVSIDSVFALSDSGVWRLFGLEFVAPIPEIADQVTPFRNASSILMPHRLAPEFGGIGGNSSKNNTISQSSTIALGDSWGLGILLLEVFNVPTGAAAPSTTNELRSPKSLPRQFLSSYSSLVAINPKIRWSVEKFQAEAEMIHGTSKIVKLMAELDELSLKDSTDRDIFYRELASCVDHVPDKIAQGLILPKISNLLQYGGCSAAALGPVLRIARKMSSEAFALRVAPSVLIMFSSNEPLIRMKLLESAQMYAKLLPEKLVSDKIWPLYHQGLTSKIPEMRELSIRALVHFAPVLTERFTSGDVPKAVLALQQDPQGAIRTNATICLGMLAKYIPADSRSKTLCNGLGRMLKDPFPASRAAAIRTMTSLSTSAEDGNEAIPEGQKTFFTPRELCEQLIPALCPILLDADTNCREIATSTVQRLLSQAVVAAESVPCSSAPSTTHTPSASGNVNPENSTTTTSAGTSISSTPSTARSPVTANSTSSTTTTTTASNHFGSSGSSSNKAAPVARSLGNFSSSGTNLSDSSSSSSNIHSNRGFGLKAKQQQQQQATTSTTTTTNNSNTASTSNDLWNDVESALEKKKPLVSSSTTTQSKVNKPAATDGWDNFGDDDDDVQQKQKQQKQQQQQQQQQNKKSVGAWDDVDEDDTEFTLAPSTKKTTSTNNKHVDVTNTTSTNTTTSTTTQHQQPQIVTLPASTATTTGGGMKLGVKKRGFGVKNN